ncbi:hypothetical protein KY338_04075 [Candidatus Woesearchaeota archaeon]|nr:hypothetical protein [Candidatus Woesearchaeota archaeon]MBW3005491.1 hypothetical protein [Candidatus Woesearchaeota archaeon]
MPRRANPRPTRRAEGKLDLYTNWLENIRNASVGRIVLVKTKKAKEILQALKVKNVIAYTNFRPEYKLFDYLHRKKKEVILLLGADRPNNALCEKLRGRMLQEKIKVSTRFRKPLFADDMKDMAGLLTFLYKHVADCPRKRY